MAIRPAEEIKRGGLSQQHCRTRSPEAVQRCFDQSPSAGPSPARGAGRRGRDGRPRSQTPPGAAAGPLGAGASRQGRVRRRAPPRCALRSTGSAPEHRRGGVAACQRPSVRVCGRSDAGLCLCQAFSPPGPDRVARAHARGGTAWLLQKRPMCGGRGPSSSQTSPRVCPRMLARTCRGDQTRPHPGPAASAPAGALRRARRGAGGGQRPGRLVSGTGAGPRGAARWCGSRGHDRSAAEHPR